MPSDLAAASPKKASPLCWRCLKCRLPIDQFVREGLVRLQRGAQAMSCKDIKKLIKRVEEDNQPSSADSSSKPITFACAKLCLKEMLDIYEYLGPNRYTNDPKVEIETPIQAVPPCKYGLYGDLHAPCSTPNQSSQRTRQSCQQQQQQDPTCKEQRQSIQQKPLKQ